VKPEAPREERSGFPAPGDADPHPAAEAGDLWEQLLSRANLAVALKRVEQNAGAPGVDGMQTNELRSWLHDHWPEVRAALGAGTYRPQPTGRVTIPKPSSGERQLGVPTALDRVIQQALSQVLVPVFDPGFSERSFGFRPGRSAHDAIRRAQRDIAEGYEWAVDLDLDRFFDRVQHDALMGRAARRVTDKKVLKLIRRYLEAGVMADGVKQPTEEGTPQGSPLSPLLSNFYLDDLDRMLEQRGHRFVRYADDTTIYVASKRAAERVMGSTSEFIERRLKLRVNRDKSSVASAFRATLLGFGFLRRAGEVKIRVDPKARKRAKDRLRKITSRRRGISMERRIREANRFTVGWTAYFALADTPRPLSDLDEWLRRRFAAGQVEGVEANPHQAPQPRRCRHPRPRGLGMGQQPQGVLADRRLMGSHPQPAERLLARAGPSGVHRPLPPFSGCDAIRRMRTRTSGGVGGAGVSPAPTRSSFEVAPTDHTTVQRRLPPRRAISELGCVCLGGPAMLKLR
jgi:group II intron reverse transcriptase/maturase